MMEQVRLPEIERIFASYPHRLSGGQRQRIMIAMALVLEPKLLIADEPTTALDVTTQKQILALIRDLQRDHGTAVLFITHDMGVVAEIADRVAVMRKEGWSRRARSRPSCVTPAVEYTRNLLSSVPSLVPRAPRAGNAGADRAGSQRTSAKSTASARCFGTAREVAAAENVTFDSAQRPHARHRRRKRLRQIDGGALHRPADRSDLRQRPTSAVAKSPTCREACCSLIARKSRSCSRILIARSIPASPSARPSPRDRSTTACRAPRRSRKHVSCSNWLVCRPTPSRGFPHQFSGGQRQRIAIARALALDPDVMVADEAVSALDVSVQAQVLELLDQIQARLGIAILFITHDLRVAAQICDDVAVMQQGRIVEQGPAAQVLTQPQEAYTRALLDAAPGRGWDFANFRPVVAGSWSRHCE